MSLTISVNRDGSLGWNGNPIYDDQLRTFVGMVQFVRGEITTLLILRPGLTDERRDNLIRILDEKKACERDDKCVLIEKWSVIFPYIRRLRRRLPRVRVSGPTIAVPTITMEGDDPAVATERLHDVREPARATPEPPARPAGLRSRRRRNFHTGRCARHSSCRNGSKRSSRNEASASSAMSIRGNGFYVKSSSGDSQARTRGGYVKSVTSL